MKTLPDIDDAIADFVPKVQKMIVEHYEEKFSNLEPPVLSVKNGSKYTKIIKTNNQISVWGFIDRSNGNVLKAESWRKPAKHARGNLYDPDSGMKYIGIYGPYYMESIKRMEKENEST